MKSESTFSNIPVAFGCNSCCIFGFENYLLLACKVLTMKLGETALPSVILADSLDAIQLPVE